MAQVLPSTVLAVCMCICSVKKPLLNEPKFLLLEYHLEISKADQFGEDINNSPQSSYVHYRMYILDDPMRQ